MKRLINWFRDRPRTYWFLIGLSVMALAAYDTPAWIPITLSSAAGAVSAVIDRRNRSATRAVRAARDAFRRPGSVAWIEGSRRFGGRQ